MPALLPSTRCTWASRAGARLPSCSVQGDSCRAVVASPLRMTRASLLGHERILVVRRGNERLLDRSGADPALQVHLRTGLVVRPRGSRATERLLAHLGSSRLVVDVKIAGRVAQ